jgi:hypothetical protein
VPYIPVISGVAPAGGVAVAASSGGSTAYGPTTAIVTNQNITLTTTGRPVKILLQSDGSGVSNCFMGNDGSGGTLVLQLVRDSTVLSYSEINSGYCPVSAMSYVDLFVPAGTHTYQLNAAGISGTCYVNFAVLVAYEI